jgi:hypothetical protein
MAKTLVDLKKALKKAKNKGGVRMALEIGAYLGYKDKKTTRKYLNPLLKEGLLGRTVPDKPNSRNQRYLTARNV